MDMASLIMLIQGLLVLVIAALVWPLIAFASRPRRRCTQRTTSADRIRLPTSFRASREG
ncbi:hypothetical protein [Chloroflexus sp.]|uniref:hypothetical protein n=1 Tax=Chloroflexus sp. TaxID=1904827 RepID=UPI002ADD50EC|nr:hypothetical protein [Chloroflexus sp.]